METYRTFHRGFVVYSMWTDTCEKQYYAQKKKKAFHCCFYLPPRQRLRMRISDKVFYLFSVQTMWSIFLRILSLRLQKAFEVPYKQKKNVFHRVKVTILGENFWMSSNICWTLFHTQFLWQNLCLEFSNSQCHGYRVIRRQWNTKHSSNYYRPLI